VLGFERYFQVAILSLLPNSSIRNFMGSIDLR
jgi:hypothetical protein